MAFYHKWNVKNGFTYVLQFFSLISDGLGGVNKDLRLLGHSPRVPRSVIIREMCNPLVLVIFMLYLRIYIICMYFIEHHPCITSNINQGAEEQ